MRTYRLPSVTPPTFGPTGSGGKKRASHIRARTADPAAELKFPDHWNKPDVRGALRAMQGYACAYCGCDLRRNDPGDVEHFRPKGSLSDDPSHGGYWWLAYDLSNFVLACRCCNSTFKRSCFPVRPGAKNYQYSRRSKLKREARLLLQPTVDDVDALIDFDLDHPLLRIVPREPVSSIQRKQIEGTVRFFDLDFEIGDERVEVATAVQQALERGDDDEVRACAARYRKHSLLVVRMLERMRPDLLPTPEQELLVLLDMLADRLLPRIQALELDATNTRAERIAQRLCWTLAVLWKDPPAADGAWMKTQLDARGLTAQVKPLFDQL